MFLSNSFIIFTTERERGHKIYIGALIIALGKKIYSLTSKCAENM